MAAYSAGGGIVTATSALRRNPIVEAFRDWACLETFPLTAWACGEWVHSIDRGDHDAISTRDQIARARRVLDRLGAMLEAIEAERPDDPEAVIHTRSFDPAARTITETWRLFDTQYPAPWGGPGFVAFQIITRHDNHAYQGTARRILTGNTPHQAPERDVHPQRIQPLPTRRYAASALHIAHDGIAARFDLPLALYWARGIRS